MSHNYLSTYSDAQIFRGVRRAKSIFLEVIESCDEERLPSDPSDRIAMLVHFSLDMSYAKKLVRDAYDRITMLRHHKIFSVATFLEREVIDAEEVLCGAKHFLEELTGPILKSRSTEV